MKDFDNYRRDLIRKLIYYPLILVVCYLPSGVLHAVNAIEPEIHKFYIMLIVGISTSMHGFLNSIVYGLNPSVKECFNNSCSGNREGYVILEES